MRYTKIERGTIEHWVNVGRTIKINQPFTYKKLVREYPRLSRLIIDEKEYSDIKYLMEERKGVMI